MRNAFAHTLLKLAVKDERIILLTGDLGYSVFEKYREACPRQYINAGVAEQSMTGVAAGLAMEGRIPVLYSITPFVTMRNFEQIRNDVCYQNLNVKIVTIGAGFTYGPYGHTHHGLEDIGILRTLARLIIICPGDPVEAELATEAMIKYKGPVYLRLGKSGEPAIHPKRPDFQIGKGIVISEGGDVALFATSTMLERGKEVSDRLNANGISVALISMHTIKPIDADLVKKFSKKVKAIFTLEEHSIIGGLGSAVSEVLAEGGERVLFKRLGVPDRFTKVIGTQEYMRSANGLSVVEICETITAVIRK